MVLQAYLKSKLYTFLSTYFENLENLTSTQLNLGLFNGKKFLEFFWRNCL